jgi:carboxylate-amine ligase
MASAVDVAVPFEEPLPDQLLAQLQDRGLPAAVEAVSDAMAAEGVTLGGTSFRVDPVPRVLTAAEWEPLATGLCQRVRALDRFVADIYGRQCIVREGVIPAAAVASAAYFEPLMQQAAHDDHRFITVAGLDVIRGPDGAFRVLKDTVLTPSGVSYALAAREAVTRAVPPPPGLEPASLEPSLAFLARALRSAAPEGVEDPVVALLTDGPTSGAYYAHRYLADRIGLELVELSDLRRRRDRLYAQIDGRDRALDVVYRRTSEARLQHERGGLTDVATLLLEPWANGKLGLVNAFGTGVADDKVLLAYVEELVRYYLDEEPLLESVRTWDLLAPGALNRAVEQLDQLVVKPRAGFGGGGVMIGPAATRAQLDRCAAELCSSPSKYAVQDFVPLSLHPTVCDGELQPCPVDLRPFVFYGAKESLVMPGGLSRVTPVGCAKDTWVIS